MSASSDINSLSYDSFVVIAEDECTMNFSVTGQNCGYTHQTESNYAMRFGALGLWECTGLVTKCNSYTCIERIALECKKARCGQLPDGIHVELFLYCRQANAKKYVLNGRPERHELNANFYAWSKSLNSECSNIRLTIRILKERALFPDLTQTNSIHADPMLPAAGGDVVQLRVQGQIFHINRRVISGTSAVLDRIISDALATTKNDGTNNSNKNKNLVELKTEHTDPALFHDFLLMISYPKGEVLPNAKNVMQLVKLGRFYDVGWVIELCANHLQLCHEMPKLERMLLAKEFGNRDLLLSVINEIGTMDECKQLITDLLDRT